MAKRIVAGSLVCMGNRNVAGQGLVINRVKDVNDYAEFDLVDAWLKLYDKNHADYFFKSERENQYSLMWTLRRDAREGISEQIVRKKPNIDKALLTEFWQYNSAYSYQKNGNKILTPKTDFCLVRWFKAPSDYGDKPHKWFKNKECWIYTRLLKQIT
jgi:hypothetical protein